MSPPVISHDVGLSVRLLRYINSAYFGMRQRIGSILEHVAAALLRYGGALGSILDAVVPYEWGDFEAPSVRTHRDGLVVAYRSALGWAQNTLANVG